MLKNPFVIIYSVVIQQKKVVINIEVITRNSNSICMIMYNNLRKLKTA